MYRRKIKNRCKTLYTQGIAVEFQFYVGWLTRLPIKEKIKIRIHTTIDLDPDEVQQSIKSHCKSTYAEYKKQVKRDVLISTIMTILGIIALTALILINHFTDNIYITSIIEIAAWVFIWEAVDFFFLQRPVVKGKCMLIQRIYTAEIEICKDEVKRITQE